MDSRSTVDNQDKRRIAQEIHDDFGQRAASLSLLLAAVKKRLPRDGALAPELDELSRNADELSEDLRRFSHELHPASLDRRGLAEVLRQHCAQVTSRHGLGLDFTFGGEPERLPVEIAQALFRVVQEGLANIVRHAEAKNVRLRLQIAHGGVTLSLADDGRGYDPTQARRVGGLGLAGIEERAEMFGGRCRIFSSSSGSEIGLWIPLPEPRTLWGQLRLLLRRHRNAALATAMVILALAGGIVATWRQAQVAREEALRADATVHFLAGLFEGANPRLNQGKVPDARDLLQRGGEKLARELVDHPLQRARLLDVLGGIETELGLYDAARPHLEESLAILRSERGEDHLEVAAALARLGKLARQSGKGEATTYFRSALAIRESQQGPADPQVIQSLNELGTALAAAGELAEAELYLRRSLAAAEKTWGGSDPKVATVLHNLAGLAHRRAANDECERLLERALAIREKTLQPDDPDLLESLEALAVLRLAQRRGDEATPLLERLLPQTQKIFGADHPNSIRVLLNLGIAKKATHHDAEAKELLLRVLSLGEKKLPADHWLLVKARENLAGLE